MSETKLVSFKPEHLVVMGGSIQGMITQEAIEIYKNNPSFTLLIDGKPVGLGGVIVLWQGVGEVWTYLTDEILKKPIFLHKQTKKILAEITTHLKLKRIQASVLFDFDKGCKWLEKLGFTRESVMPLYGANGETFVRYVRLEGLKNG